MADRDIRPCPFCGSHKVTLDYNSNHGHGDRTFDGYRVKCLDCDGTGFGNYGDPTEADMLRAIDAWNKRV